MCELAFYWFVLLFGLAWIPRESRLCGSFFVSWQNGGVFRPATVVTVMIFILSSSRGSFDLPR